MNLIQEDNFFPNLNLILPEIKKIKLYSQEEIRQIDKHNKNATWPGYRSLSLTETNPILHDYVCYLMNVNNLLEKGRWIIASFVHLRLYEDENKDWIHRYDNELSGLVYLSNTNLNSGTYLYDGNDNMINDIKFIKNRFIMYRGTMKHKAYGHHGSSIDDGRLTLNLFIKQAVDKIK